MYINYIRPRLDLESQSDDPTYFRIFVLLVLCERGNEIDNFIKEGMSDQKLPVCRHDSSGRERVNLCSKTKPDQILKPFFGWKISERVWFEREQWQVLVPFFKLDSKNIARRYDLDDKTILPWGDRHSLMSSQSSKSNQQSEGSLLTSQTAQSGSMQEGGFADVTRIRIDPLIHGFSGVLKHNICLNDSLFALKKLHETDHNNEERFYQETELLKRFSDFVNNNLVTLLATFTYQKRYHSFFPYAEHDLDHYWTEKERSPEMDVQTVRWVAKQCSGIMAGIDTIHRPPPANLLDLTEQRYGILVISDMGLSTLNRETSRSGLARYNIPRVPGYSPPECDVKGGTISRAYDIWTLGCLFMELLTWLIGGSALREKFEKERTTEYTLTGAKNKNFFAMKVLPGESKGFVTQVKDEVSQWFHKLHNHKKCSQFVHEALYIIQNEMLLVISEDKKISESGPLKKKFEDLYLKCMNDSNVGYCIKGDPQRRPVRSSTGVTIIPSDNAEFEIKNRQLKFQTYEGGKTRKSIQPDQYEKTDEI